jgi:hypothetical protein
MSGQPGVPFSIGPSSSLFLAGVNTLSVVVTSSDSTYGGINVLISSATAALKTGEVQSHRAIYASVGRPGPSELFQQIRPLHRGPVLESSVFESKDDSFWYDDFLFPPILSSTQELASPISLNFGPRDVRPPATVPQDGELPLYRGTSSGEMLVAERNESISEHP